MQLTSFPRLLADVVRIAGLAGDDQVVHSCPPQAAEPRLAGRGQSSLATGGQDLPMVAFYAPNNMVLAAAGNTTMEQILAACERNGLMEPRPAERVQRLWRTSL